MGSLWRSEDMRLIQLVLPREAVHNTVEILGRESIVQFLDMYDESDEHANTFQRPSATEVKKCEELQRKIRYFESEIASTDSVSLSTLEPSDDVLFEFGPGLDELDDKFTAHETELVELNKRLDLLMKQKNSKDELKYVLLQGDQFFKAGSNDVQSVGGSRGGMLSSRDEPPSDAEPFNASGSLRFITGVINRDKVHSFMQLCYRATRGLMIPRFVEIQEPLYDVNTQTYVEKNVFIIFFNADIIGLKITKICESIGAHVHEIPSSNSLEETRRHLDSEIEDHSFAIQQSLKRRLDVLSEISTSMALWTKYVQKEKGIYHIENMFKFMATSAYAQGWCPAKYEKKLQEILDRATATSQAEVPSSFEVIPIKEHQISPTYFEETEFVASFQKIIDAYGVPAYKEVNPAVLSTILFPFLFAVMFGDYGHGFIMFLFALTLVIFQSKLRNFAETNEMFGMVFQGRYIVLLMGLFSMYTGLLYNDIFSLSLENFGQSAYSFDEFTGVGTKVRRTYPFGVDPAWYGTTNRLSYYNSVKMKMSIIFGLAHMMVGLFLGLSNHIYFGHLSHILFEFIPEVLILGCTFGYLGVMIIIKWCTDWVTDNRHPPSLLNTMTDFFLHPWGIQQDLLFVGQLPVQLTLLLIAVASIPVLLLPLPIMKIMKRMGQNKQKNNREISLTAYDTDDAQYSADLNAATASQVGGMGSPMVNNSAPEDQEEEEDSPSEIFIKQLIHTIEFVLGAVSNTASYLRLWALSLAHSQLSDVFWEMTIGLVLNFNQGGGIVEKLVVNTGLGFLVAFAAWFMATIAVLLGMESLSAFLHTLRLVWVEHNSKFYAGTGVPFEPFSFARKVVADTA
uniref:V-type proton ATPase subunit a n=1 Tax=Percolomonas cosmopolitus TaxID=63605 RepID=A0A7S1KSN2_9EUKA|eukprot:CAMPEP_0117440204 /NCGR_PEP_ID=MMETSP0759-20121206/2963_1 /TAXON_ID=63605 /ORGANISM="Percolomonas cosmopolitus, Strain WS" /LENGTH=848 /DNA_ID=CAMNT_0005231949 /DNA_START=113 /DNA_END=2659 /DNA_ORIENTATION=-